MWVKIFALCSPFATHGQSKVLLLRSTFLIDSSASFVIEVLIFSAPLGIYQRKYGISFDFIVRSGFLIGDRVIYPTKVAASRTCVRFLPLEGLQRR